MTVEHLHPITLSEAEQILDAIGYNESWSMDQLFAAVSENMLRQVITALRVTATARHAEANGLEA